MTITMRLLGRLGGLREEQNVEGGEATTASHGAGATFSPTTVVQTGEGLFDQRAKAEAQEAAEEETGSIGGEAIVDPETALKPEPSQTPAEDDRGAEDGSGEASEGTYTYGGVEVQVENTPEMIEAFKEKDLSIDDINKELYSEEGLTDDTRNKLNEAFGKASVDMYLNGLEKANKAFIETHNNSVDKFNSEIDNIIKSVVGEGIETVFEWANKNLSPEEYNAYQKIINGDNTFSMKMALKDLANRSGINQILTPPTVKESVRETALTATNTVVDHRSAMLSKREYLALFVPDENGRTPYYDDQAKYDAMRNAGRDAGV